MSAFEADSEFQPLIFVVIGQVRPAGETAMVPFNALLAAPDDDTAVRLLLESLAQEGYEEADLHQIGNIDERPQEAQFQNAYDSALSGDIAIVVFESGDDPAGEEIPTVH